jgi:hypothetical protein
MENAIVAIISTVLIILSSVIMTMSTLQATSKLSGSWQAMTAEFDSIRTTSISAEPEGDYYGGPIELDVANNGQSNLCDFSQWDVIAQYEDGTATYLTYDSGTLAGNNEWAVQSINIGPGQLEIFDPGILNPGEYLRVQINLDPGLAVGYSARITIATPDGVTAQCLITQQAPP